MNEATFLAFLANSKQIIKIFTHHFLLSAMLVGGCKFTTVLQIKGNTRYHIFLKSTN